MEMMYVSEYDNDDDDGHSRSSGSMHIDVD